jgi:hypothetical protein
MPGFEAWMDFWRAAQEPLDELFCDREEAHAWFWDFFAWRGPMNPGRLDAFDKLIAAARSHLESAPSHNCGVIFGEIDRVKALTLPRWKDRELDLEHVTA